MRQKETGNGHSAVHGIRSEETSGRRPKMRGVIAAKVPRINGDAMVRCCRIAIGFFKVVVEVP